MARRDYKDSGRPRGGRKDGPRKGGGWLPGLMLGLVAGLLAAAALVWYFSGERGGFKTLAPAPREAERPAPREREPKPAPPVPAAPPVKPAPAPAPAPAPQAPAQAGQAPYTFYDILPGGKPVKPAEPPPRVEVWWVQVAALRKAEDADRLRARLALLNLESAVRPPGTATPALYRVRVGPFRGEAEARAALATLTANDFEARLLKEPVEP